MLGGLANPRGTGKEARFTFPDFSRLRGRFSFTLISLEMNVKDTFPTYICDAMKIMKKVGGELESLPTLPPIVTELPLSSSFTFTKNVDTIFGDIGKCLDAVGLSEEDKDNLYSVAFNLGRFLFIAPVREKDSKGGSVSVFSSVQERTKLFLTDGGPLKLWNDHVNVSLYLDKCAGAEAEGMKLGLSSSLTEKEKRRIEQSMGRGDIHVASRQLSSEFRIMDIKSEEEAKKIFYDLYDQDAVQEPQLIAMVERVLAQAVTDGVFLPPTDPQYEALVSLDAVKRRASRYTKDSGADFGGMRPAFFKSFLKSFGAGTSAVIVRICDDIVSGRVPKKAAAILASSSFFVLQHIVKEEKLRRVSPPASAWLVLATSVLMDVRKAVNNANVAPIQLAVGTRGGVDVGGHAYQALRGTAIEAATDKDAMWDIVADAQGFFYNVRQRAWVQALIDQKDYVTLRAAFSLLSNGMARVVIRTVGRQSIFLPLPTNGLPVGHPFAAYLATLPVSRAYKDALRECTGGDPTVKARFSQNLCVKAYMDDFHFVGVRRFVLSFLREFVPLLHASGAAKFGPGKGYAAILSRNLDLVLTPAEATRIFVAVFGTKTQQAEFFQGTRSGGTGTGLKSTVGKESVLPCPQSGHGVKFLGGYCGGAAFMEEAAEKCKGSVDLLAARVGGLGYKDQLTMMQYSISHKHNHLLRQNGGSPEFKALWEYVDHSSTTILKKICGILRPEDQVQIPLIGRWTPTQLLVARLPVSKSGLGIESHEEAAPIAFLAGHLALTEYVAQNETVGSLLHRSLELVWEERNGSEYARQVHRSVNHYLALFRSVKKRSPTLEEDGYNFQSLDTLPPAIKFQSRAKSLIDSVNAEELLDVLDDQQRSEYLVDSQGGSISWYTSLGFPIADPVVTTLLQNRLLMSNPGGFLVGDRCPGKGCNLKNSDINASHAMGCVHIGPKGCNSFLHETFRRCIQELLSFSRVSYDPQDLTHHKGVLGRLKAAGFKGNNKQGLRKGADILAHNIMGAPGQLLRPEIALDGTVTSKRGTPDDPKRELIRCEGLKYGTYHDMYDLIDQVDTLNWVSDGYVWKRWAKPLGSD